MVTGKPNARGYNWATLFLGDINTGTWPSKLGTRGYNWATLFLGDINTGTWPSKLGTQCPGVKLGHPVPGGYKYGNLALQVGNPVPGSITGPPCSWGSLRWDSNVWLRVLRDSDH
jgi:hypothetical protein